MPATPTPAPAKKPRGNPNLALAPRCGARTRAGYPCRAPAIRGKQRCRMHGGRSTGPRTAEGRARLRAAHTTHGRYDADHRARDRLVLTRVRRMRVLIDAIRHRARLPADLVARLDRMAPELAPPPWPTSGLSRAEDRAQMRAEVEALAPWRRAIAAAKLARRTEAAARRQPAAPSTAPQSPAEPLAPAAPPAARQAMTRPCAPGTTGHRAPASQSLPPAALSPATQSPPRPLAPETPPAVRHPAPTPPAPEATGPSAPPLAQPVTAPHAPGPPLHRSLTNRRDYLLASGSPTATFQHWCTDPRYRRFTPRLDFSGALPAAAGSLSAALAVRPAASRPHPAVPRRSSPPP